MAEKSILDTSILIDAIDHGRHTDLLNSDNSISVISIYEFIRYKKRALENKLLLEDSFNVIGINNPILLKSTEIFVKLRAKGETISENDIYIAAAALSNSMRLYTKDRDFLQIKKHFKDFKLELISD